MLPVTDTVYYERYIVVLLVRFLFVTDYVAEVLFIVFSIQAPNITCITFLRGITHCHMMIKN